MTTTAQVTALVMAHVDRDNDRFKTITYQIAAHLTGRSADQLRKLVDRQQAMSAVPLPSAVGLLSTPTRLATLDEMVLAPSVRGRLDRIVLEQSRRFDLLTQGLHPARKLLFTGVPGVGKTMAAGALAQAIKMPLFRVELHGVISQYMGETSAKLAKVFEHVRSMPAVYLFDEFDALGANRDSLGGEAAGAEMRRIVNSLLQFIEDDQSDSLIVAATNHATILDKAIFRRFDESITFPAPSKDEIGSLVARAGIEVDIDISAIYGAVANQHLGHADLCKALDRVRKDQMLIGTPIDTEQLVQAVASRAEVRS